MSLRYEQHRSLRHVRQFLFMFLECVDILLSIPGLPRKARKLLRELRSEALRSLRHFPALRETGEPIWSQDDCKQPDGSAAAPKPPRPYHTGYWPKTCDQCKHQEGRHYCLLLRITVKNMDTKRCREWEQRQNDKVSDPRQ